MSIRTVTCPGCGATANVPAAMTNVRCPACATVWNVSNPSGAQVSAAAKQRRQAEAGPDKATQDSAQGMMIAGGLIGGAILMVMMFGILVWILNRDTPTTAASPTPVETIKPRIPEEYRVVNLPEADRQRIYRDYRTVARTTVEKPLALPQGTKLRQSVEEMLEKTYDRELMRFAALHDISVEDVKEVIKEGDAKVWDDSARSHAVRDGKRVYAEERSEGWELNKNRK